MRMRNSKKLISNGKDTFRRSSSSSNVTRDRRWPNPTGFGNLLRRPLAASSRHEIMTETEGMKSPSKSFDQFEFKVEDDPAEMPVKKIATEFGCPQTFNAENYAEKTPELNHVLCNDFVSHGQVTENKDIESGFDFSSVEYGSSPGATLQMEDHSNSAFPVSSCNVKSICLASDALNNMNERSSSDINNASSEGTSSDNCSNGGDLDDEREVVFDADYVDYQGRQYLNSVVCFSSSYVEARGKAIYGNEETFHIHLEIEDIFKIESKWSTHFEAGTINIHFIAKDAAEVEFDAIHNASGLQQLKFPAVEPNWYEKREAIESLDVRYKSLWNALLDGDDSSLRESEDWMLSRNYFPKFDRPFEEVIYPKGDPDAVSISKRDVDLLLPDTFVNDTIIDFYIKYLKTRLTVDERTKFHFFNSFFFRKLADLDKDPSSAADGKAAFQRVRKWTRKVNLLEKDFILIPVNYNLHWSLIVICYFGEVSSYEDGDDKSGRVPCILHMDSLRGTHSGLKDLMQSYLWEEWKERQKGTCEDLYSKFRNLKFVSLELPQQQNSYDCGLFLLHYVELFLEEVTCNFNIYKITSSINFLHENWFPPTEPSVKRTHIEKLISGLLDSKSEECRSGSPEDLNTTHAFEDDIQFTVKSNPLGGYHESSLCQVGQGIEMTLLPTISTRSTQCTDTSGLVLKELFKQGSVPESFADESWGSLENRASILELKKSAHPTEGEVKASECFVTTELDEHDVFQHPDGVTPEAPTFPYTSQDFRSEAIFGPSPEGDDSISVTSDGVSGGLLDAEGSQGLDDISAPDRDLFLTKNFSQPDREENQLHSPSFASDEKLNVVESEGPHQSAADRDLFLTKNFSQPDREENQLYSPSFASDEKLNVVECEGSHRRLDSNVEGNGEAWVSETGDEEHAAKRMRISPPDGGEELHDNLSHDLNL